MEKQISKNPINVRNKIIESAIKCFSKKGYFNTSLRDIALDAKISKGGLYHHFPTKEDLFVAVCKHSKDLIMKKTLEFLKNKGAFTIGGDEFLFKNLCEYYDKIVVKNKTLERIWVEGIMESAQNPKLKKLMLKIEKQNLIMGTEWLKQIRDNSDLLHGYNDLDLADIANGYVALSNGVVLDGVMGKDPKKIRMTWIRTYYAIYNSKK